VADATVETQTVLDALVAGKRDELSARLSARPLATMERLARSRPVPIPLVPALRGDAIRLIAEIKKASPAAGLLEVAFNPVARALSYARAGASAISILTEERHFLGNLDHMEAVRDALELECDHPSIGAGRARAMQRPPLLRKDFLFEPYHLFEARAAGADAVLLIVAILPQHTLDSLLALTSELGLAAVVEVHDEREVERALAAGAQIIGINNRDLRTFATSLEVTELLRPQIPAGPIVISESGIHRTADIERLAAAGIDAILVGEALMRSGDVGQSVREFSNVPARAVK